VYICRFRSRIFKIYLRDTNEWRFLKMEKCQFTEKIDWLYTLTTLGKIMGCFSQNLEKNTYFFIFLSVCRQWYMIKRSGICYDIFMHNIQKVKLYVSSCWVCFCIVTIGTMESQKNNTKLFLKAKHNFWNLTSKNGTIRVNVIVFIFTY